VKKGILALLVFAAAAAASGDLTKYKDWAKSPESYFLTPPEREEWTKVKSDEEAEKFIQLYWAKRAGPNPVTDNRDFRPEISRRIDAADNQFKMRRYERGAQSVRGRLIVVLGPPNKQMRERAQETEGNTRGSGNAREDLATAAGGSVFLTWIYEKDHFPADWDVGELRVKILIDQVRGIDELQIGTPVENAIARVAEKSIVNPSGAVAASAPKAAAPAARPVAAGATPAVSAAAPPPALVAANLPAAVRLLLDAAGKEKRRPEGSFWGGPFRTLAGDPFYAFELTLPAEKAVAGVKLGGVVTSEAGEDKASFWEDPAWLETKTGAGVSKVVTRSVSLPPGSYRASVGLFPADGSAPLVSAASDFKLEPGSNAFEVSPLILANEPSAPRKAPAPTDPFVFRPKLPIQVVPKADGLFASKDSLWYFYAVRNPAKPPASAEPTAGSAAPGQPSATPAAAAEAPFPRLMATIMMLRDGQQAFQTATAPAELEPFGEAAYGGGREIPLESFKPGFYTFVLTVRDLNAPRDSAAFKGLERRSDFVVLKPDGSRPDKPAPAVTPAAKAPAKAPAKKG
jgi:GWxTD domain-containing protein